jgi:phosphopantothenoylcysteine decarboxylase/phosphopantothenate--cysteine ligase
MLQHKKIILGITGGIAAYKCAHLVRLLVKEGATVRVVMTPAAARFVTPETLSVLSRNQVLTDFFDKDFNWNNHVHLAEWADLMLIAPLTANTLAKMASGACDNLLLATYLSARVKTFVAPAMDLEMYRHPSVRVNLEKLRQDGVEIIPAETGELASGLTGEGRMAEPENILSFLNTFYAARLPLAGRSALVNAGPTYEPIDPVRFIGNRSSGRMGVALAEALASMGASVTLVLGPSHQQVEHPAIRVFRVETSDEMYEAMIGAFGDKDIVICSAAVADYKAASVSDTKIKKKEEAFRLDLVRTRDILAELGRRKTTQCLVGFALETERVLEYAAGKLKAKNLDFIVANSAAEPGSGFGSETNRVSILDKHNKITNFELKNKRDVADDIVSYILDFIK